MAITMTATSPQMTQNTAPIIEHRCLYTHDIKRKAKRWQDGILRFHTFNKRIMVYDIPRNYIGDTHWREANAVQDGDELELDRHVLVQVCDQVATAEQDLSGILEKRKKKDPIPDVRGSGQDMSPLSLAGKTPAKSPHAPVLPSSSSSMSSMLQPKSLNALLGKSKGKLGRASLPSRSPFEVRTDSSHGGIEERSPKRLRLDNSGEQRSEHVSTESLYVSSPTSVDNGRHPAAIHADRLTKPNRGENRYEQKKPGKVTATPQRGGEIRYGGRDLSSSPEVLAVRSKSAENRQVDTLVATKQSKPPLRSPRTTVIATSTSAVRRRKSPKAVISKPLLPKPMSPRLAASVDASHSAVEHPRDAGSEKPRPRALLQMASRKPRRKLMYRELLPDAGHVTVGHTGHDTVEVRTSRKVSKNASNLGSEDHSSPSALEDDSDAISPIRRPTAKSAEVELSPRSDYNTHDGVADEAESPGLNVGRAGQQPPILEHQLSPVPDETERKSQTMASSLLNTMNETFQSTFDDSLWESSTFLNAVQGYPGRNESSVNSGAQAFQRGTERVMASAKEAIVSRKAPLLRTSVSLPPHIPVAPCKRVRSPLKPSLSESSVSARSNAVVTIVEPPVGTSAAQLVDAWSRDAWDLFGCNKDGNMVTYRGFLHPDCVEAD